MAKIKILLADLDENYLITLYNKFIEELDDSVELIVVTKQDYLDQFFATPQNLEILLINENLYNKSYEKHDIKKIYLLTEQGPGQMNTGDLDVKCIYKYTSVIDIYNEVVNSSKVKDYIDLLDKKETEVITVYSSIGGIGKTTICAGLCTALVKNYKKVLYVSIDSIQSFGFLFSNITCLPADIEKKFTVNNEYISQEIRPYINKEVFEYIPPFRRSMSSLNITINEYIYLIEEIKKTNEYDYIVIDSITDFNLSIAKLMGISNKVFIITGQDDHCAFSLEKLLENIDTSDINKFRLICNKYFPNKTNFLVDGKYEKLCRVSEYVEYNEELVNAKIEQLYELNNMKKIALMCI